MSQTTSEGRALVTVMFTDVVRSTELASSLGDRRWQELLRRHHAFVRASLKRHRGREIDTAGDGFFVIFDRPAVAIACAIEIIDSVRRLGIEVRIGLHVGEVELSGRGASGIAVHAGARVVAEAGAGEVLVTAMVKDLVAGSGIEFQERGSTTFKGVDGEWRLYRVVWTAAADSQLPPEPHADAGAARARRRYLPVALLGVAGLAIAVALGAWLLLARPGRLPTADTVSRIPSGAAAFDLIVDVGKRPTALALADGAIWVVNFTENTLSRIDPLSGNVSENPAVGGAPTGSAAGEGKIWVSTGFGQSSGDAAAIVRFDARTAARESVFPLGRGPAAMAFGERRLWVADRLRDVLVEIDPTTNVVISETMVDRAPLAVVVGAGSIWVASGLDRSVTRIDPRTHEVTARIVLSTPPTAIAIGTDTLWVTSEQADTVTGISTVTNNTIATISVGNGPRGVAVAGNSVWVALGTANKVVEVDASTNAVVATLSVDGSPEAMLADERGNVWVSAVSP